MCSCHSILECCITCSGVKLSIRSFVLFICLLVLVRPFQPETILFRWMKTETAQLVFVQSMLNLSSDLIGRIKLVKFRFLFIQN